MEKKVIIYSYYSPEELTGIGKYNGEMMDWLHDKGLEIVSISNVPFYPFWKKYDGNKNLFYSRRKTMQYLDIRTWVYIPVNPSTIMKILSELTFVITSSFALLINLKVIRGASLFLVINPPFYLGILPNIISRFMAIKTLFHVQDLQVDAAMELQLLPKWLCRVLETVELRLLRSSSYVSTISEGMIKKITKKGISPERILSIPNWAELQDSPLQSSTWLHDHLKLDHGLKLIVYSGNIGEKQGLEVVLEAAKELKDDSRIHFVILGAGLRLKKLKNFAKMLEIENFTFSGLVPKENLMDMLSSSYLQLVIQKSVGADSFLPSKLTNILAAGRCSIVTAEKDTSLFNILSPNNAAYLVRPDDYRELKQAIIELIADDKLYNDIGHSAFKLAKGSLSIDKCLSPLLKLID